MSVEQIDSTLIYGNQWLRLREDRVRREDGSEGIYSVVEREDFVAVVPFQDGMITLVEQFATRSASGCGSFPWARLSLTGTRPFWSSPRPNCVRRPGLPPPR